MMCYYLNVQFQGQRVKNSEKWTRRARGLIFIGWGAVGCCDKPGRGPPICYTAFNVITQVSIRKCKRVAVTWKCIYIQCIQSQKTFASKMSVHTTFSLGTGPSHFPERVLQQLRSSASSSKFQHLLFSLN